jgi:hypothetical protein
VFVVGTSLGPCARVPTDPKHRRRVLDVDKRQEGSQEHLGVGSVASGVRDTASRTSDRSIVKFCSTTFKPMNLSHLLCII